LESDLALIRKAFNQRVLYFRQLQEISDSVAEADWEESSFLAAQQACQAEMAELERKINTARARLRYLDNLAQNKDDNEENDQTCILCRCEFARGFITQW
jgi:E3 ubiquitin-protein ligase SHPRH